MLLVCVHKEYASLFFFAGGTEDDEVTDTIAAVIANISAHAGNFIVHWFVGRNYFL